VGWILRLVRTGADGGGQSTEVMEINEPDDIGDNAHLGLNLGEAKLLLAGAAQEWGLDMAQHLSGLARLKPPSAHEVAPSSVSGEFCLIGCSDNSLRNSPSIIEGR
jgi:hypothetical protein